MVQNHLLLCSLNDILLDCSLGDQPVNIHLKEVINIRLWCNHLERDVELSPVAYLLFLANPVSPGLSL